VPLARKDAAILVAVAVADHHLLHRLCSAVSNPVLLETAA
jgi:hypothetical protein